MIIWRSNRRFFQYIGDWIKQMVMVSNDVGIGVPFIIKFFLICFVFWMHKFWFVFGLFAWDQGCAVQLPPSSGDSWSYSARLEVWVVSDTKQCIQTKQKCRIKFRLGCAWPLAKGYSPVFYGKSCVILCLKNTLMCLWCVPGEEGERDPLFGILTGVVLSWLCILHGLQHRVMNLSLNSTSSIISLLSLNVLTELALFFSKYSPSWKYYGTEKFSVRAGAMYFGMKSCFII